MISDLHPGTAHLTARPLGKLSNSFRPSTQAAYNRAWKDFWAFLVVAALSMSEVNHPTFLAYMEHLSSDGFPQQILQII